MHAFDRPVGTLMSSPVETISGNATIEDALTRLQGLQVSSLLVVDHLGTSAGVISRTDLLRRDGALVRDRMSHPVVTAEVDASIATAARTMWVRQVHRVYVVERGRPVGVCSTREIMLAVREARHAAPIGELMTSPVVTIEVARPAVDAIALLERLPLSSVVAVEDEHAVGLFTQREALAAAAHVPGAIVDDVMTPALLCLRGTIPAYRAAAFSVSTRARRIVVVHEHAITGIVSGMDFVRLVADGPGRPAGVVGATR